MNFRTAALLAFSNRVSPCLTLAFLLRHPMVLSVTQLIFNAPWALRKISGALVMPCGRRGKQYPHNGVINVLRLALAGGSRAG